ncbi:MAG: hypothetical protein JWL93_681 [Hyphomicrobiales bacterium]|jgi:hypothetical protein|nr:hypothetical protein [Hyphomicrobiales bacterium]
MSEKYANPLVRVLARWGLTEAAPPELQPQEDQAILQALGAAVIARWADLPRDVQRSLFDAAVHGGRPDREAIAVFLHDHHRNTQKAR